MSDRPFQDLGFPVLAALAYRLLDPTLVRVPPAPLQAAITADDRLAALLCRSPLSLDPTTAHDAVRLSRKAARDDWTALGLLARQLVAIEGGRPVSRHASAWDGLCRIVDTDALVAWHLATIDPFEADGDLLRCVDWPPVPRAGRSGFESALAKAMSETHLHLGGALASAVQWMFTISHTIPLELALPQLDADEADRWTGRIALAAAQLTRLARSLLAPQGLSERWDDDVPIGEPGRELASALSRLVPLDGTTAADRAQATALWPLGGATVRKSPLRASLAAERVVLWGTLARLRRQTRTSGLRDALVAYLRVKNAFHFALLHQAGPRGLVRFRDVIERRRALLLAGGVPIRGASRVGAELERRRIDQVLECYLRDAASDGTERLSGFVPPLDVEVRVTPRMGRQFLRTFVAWTRGVRDALKRWPDAPVRVGFILQYHKSKNAEGVDVMTRHAEAVVETLREDALLRPLVVGIDVAGAEIDSNPRQHAPLYHSVRRRLDDPVPVAGLYPVRLGFTYHVGEDFRDLLTGIRHVDEAAHLLAMRPGDRLGHALSLAWEPKSFYGRHRSSHPLMGEHALDLLWAYSVLRRQPDSADHSHAAAARERLVGIIASRSGDPDAATRVEKASAALDPNGVDGADRAAPRSERELLALLNLSPDVSTGMHDVGADESWCRFVESLQALARSRVGRKHLVIELNPTSNVLVCGFQDYSELPYLRMNSRNLVARPPTDPDLPVSLNSDDPGILHTTLRTEYLSVAESLLAQGYALRDVAAWIDEARSVGRDSTFIPPWAPQGPGLIRHIEHWLDGTGA